MQALWLLKIIGFIKNSGREPLFLFMSDFNWGTVLPTLTGILGPVHYSLAFEE